MKNDINDKTTVKYDEVRVALLRKQGIDIREYSAKDLFINGNFPNKKDINEESFEVDRKSTRLNSSH